MNGKIQDTQLRFDLKFAVVAVFLACASAQAQQTLMPGPPGSERFGASVTYLPNGNLVVIDPAYDIPGGALNVGSVWIYRPDGSVLSQLTGAFAGDQLGNAEVTRTGGKVWLLNGSKFLVRSNWNAGRGSVTWIDGDIGLNGAVSALNSLVGNTAADSVGTQTADTGLTVLSNGDYVVHCPTWDAPAAVNAGAVTVGPGATGIRGVVSAANSLIGSRVDDFVGDRITPLSNGNFVVVSTRWDRLLGVGNLLTNAGAITWSSSASPLIGEVSESNSLTTDNIFGPSLSMVTTITPLTNGNFAISMPGWANRSVTPAIVSTGAVLWASGTAPITGQVGVSNALIGVNANDEIGQTVTALADGNYLISSDRFSQNRGIARWLRGDIATTGTIDSGPALIGTSTGHLIARTVTALPNGAYLILSPQWDRNGINDVGALTFGAAGTAISGAISASNSLVGVRVADINGETRRKVTVLSNGNFVFSADGWDNGTSIDAGAAVFGSATAGVVGEISAANALIGTSAGDTIGSTQLTIGASGVVALSNGHYVVNSNSWDNGGVTNVGAATWGNGVTGTVGIVGPSNSLIGERSGHGVGGTVALSNGHYVVLSGNREAGLGTLGAVTWCDGTGPTSSVMNLSNSLMGQAFNDAVGSRVTALSDGNYVVSSWDWRNSTLTRAGAITWGNGQGGTVGLVSPNNSLVGGRVDDRIGRTDLAAVGPGALALPDGNYVIPSQYFTSTPFRGATTLGMRPAAGVGRQTGVLTGSRLTALGGMETSNNFTVRVDYYPPSKTLAVGQSANNRVVLLETMFTDGFE